MSCLRRLIDIIKWHNRELPQVHAFVAVFLSGSFGQRDCSRLSYLGRPARGTRTGVPHCGPLNKAGALDAQCRQRVYTANKASAAWSITLYTLYFTASAARSSTPACARSREIRVRPSGLAAHTAATCTCITPLPVATSSHAVRTPDSKPAIHLRVSNSGAHVRAASARPRSALAVCVRRAAATASWW